MYPFFEVHGVGKTEVMIPMMYSSKLGNYRDINVYTPYSLLENSLRRAVNILILHDGFLDPLKLFAVNGGLDSLNGVGSSPELVIIGVPHGYNGTACPTTSTGCYQRTFELTPTDCDPSRNTCDPNQKYGGLGLYLDFVYDDVIPEVLERLGMDMGEVSNAGFR